MDGANIANPAFGYLRTDVNELDIAEVNLKRAGITAEFGRTGGAVTNAVSRSGSNRVAAMARIDWLSEGSRERDALPTNCSPPVSGRERFAIHFSPARRPPPSVSAVPSCATCFLLRVCLYSRQTKWDRVNKAGTTLPDEVRTGQRLWQDHAVPAASHQINASYRSASERDGRRAPRLHNGAESLRATPTTAAASPAPNGRSSWARAGRSTFVPLHEGEERGQPSRTSGTCRRSTPTTCPRWDSTPIPAQADLKVGGASAPTSELPPARSARRPSASFRPRAHAATP